MSVKIIVDSSADMSAEVKNRICVVPLSVFFGDEEYLDGVTLDYTAFYEKLAVCENLPTTSQANPATFEKVFEEVEKAGDSAVVITLSSTLSGTCQSAMIAAADFDNIYVVDGTTATIGTGVLVERALQLVDEGKSAEEIANILNEEKRKVRIVAVVDTLEYLQRGGRISKAVALAGSMLSIKPIIAVQEGKLEMISKARGLKQAFRQIGAEAGKMGEVDFTKPVILGFTGAEAENLEKYEKDYSSMWQQEGTSYTRTAIGSAIGTHVGPGAVATAFFVK